MQYTDADSRDQFHKTSTFFQLVCAMLESFCFLHLAEPEFIVMASSTGAYVGVPGVTEEQLTDIRDKLNRQFTRSDGKLTCSVTDPGKGVLRLYVTGPEDLSAN